MMGGYQAERKDRGVVPGGNLKKAIHVLLNDFV
jgi:hypothetical protein